MRRLLGIEFSTRIVTPSSMPTLAEPACVAGSRAAHEAATRIRASAAKRDANMVFSRSMVRPRTMRRANGDTDTDKLLTGSRNVLERKNFEVNSCGGMTAEGSGGRRGHLLLQPLPLALLPLHRCAEVAVVVSDPPDRLTHQSPNRTHSTPQRTVRKPLGEVSSVFGQCKHRSIGMATIHCAADNGTASHETD